MAHDKLCQDLLYTLYGYGIRPEFRYERQVAQELYAISTGQVNDDDPFYEQRLFCFQDFFIFDYRLSEVFSGSTVFETFLYNSQGTLERDLLTLYEELRTFDHSLFQILEYKEAYVVVKDLFSQQTYKAFPLPHYTLAGLDNKRQIVEGRLITLQGQHYFTGAFILHSQHVFEAVQKHMHGFLKQKNYSKAGNTVEWTQELMERKNLLSIMAEQKVQIQNAERKRAIDLLQVTKKLAEIPRQITSQHLIMALGKQDYISPFVPETPFYNKLHLLHVLAYCEVRSYRYKHLDPVKIYQLGAAKLNQIPA